MEETACNLPGASTFSSAQLSPDIKAGWLARVLFWSLTCMIIISLLSLINLQILRQTGWWRNHTHQAIERIYSIEQSLADSGAAYQAYRATQDTAELWRSDQHLAETERQLRALRGLIQDNPEQSKRLDALEALMKIWSGDKSVLANARRPFVHGFPILLAMRKEEERLLVQRSTEMEFVRSTTGFMSVGLLLFSVVSLAFLWRKWNRENAWTSSLLRRLHVAEARFLTFMDNSPLPAFITDSESRLIYSNRAWNKSMSVPPDGPGQIPVQLSQHDTEIQATGKTVEFLERVPTSKNELCDWLVVRFPFSSDGQSTLLGGFALDVTAARRIQMALEESEERLRLALKSASMQVWDIAIEEGKIGSSLLDFCVSHDNSSDKIKLSEALGIICPEQRAQTLAVLKEAIENQTSFDTVYKTVAGRWIASCGLLQFDDEHRPVRMIGFRRDQTEKIEAERSLARLTQLHDSILKSTHVALISINQDRIVTTWNPAAERLLGYTAEEVIGIATPDLWLDPNDARVLAKRLDMKGNHDSNPFLSKALLRGEETQECTFIRKNGSKILVRLTVTPIFNDDGSLFGFLEHATDISEFRRASHQIQELNDALEHTVSGWAKLDNKGRYIAANKSYAETVGYPLEELIGLDWKKTVYPQDLPYMVQVYEDFLATGKGEALARGIRKNGSVFYKQVSLFPAYDYMGDREGCYRFMRDVTARVEAEQKLEASERRYREFFELNPLPCWIYDPQTLRFLDVNEAAVQHYGYTREQFLSMTQDDIRIPEESDLIEREFTKFGQRPSWTSGPWHNRLRDGTLIEVEIAARNVSDRARLAVIRDVTEQREVELIRKSEAKLQEAQQIARLGSWELDTKSGAVSWSPETYRIFGREGLAGKFLYEEFLSMIHPEDRDEVASAVRNSVLQKQLYDLQFRILRRDGEMRHIHGRGQFSNGSRQCLTGTMLDVTDQKRAQEALQQSLEEKEVLLKEVHHRVKNNLQVISCLLNMQAGAVTEEAAVAALRESERRVMAMAVIHERLYGNKRMDRIDFREYAESLADDLIQSYAQQGAQIKGCFSLESIDLNIEQAIPCGLILNELITNALKYAYPDGAGGPIFVDLQHAPNQKLQLSVSDHGRGLPENFDWRKSKSLGVTIVNLLTKQLGGNLTIESSGSGTTFTVVFPKAS